jgi:hypothetical protein
MSEPDQVAQLNDELLRAYQLAFGSPAGQAVLADLVWVLPRGRILLLRRMPGCMRCSKGGVRCSCGSSNSRA